MDFEEFRENLMEDLRDQIYQRTGNDCTVEATNVAKLQNAGYEGIVIRPEESPVGINLDAKFKLAAGKTAKSILVSCGARLAPFDISELREITSYDELQLDTLGDRKTALFLIMSDNDPTFNFLISMVYSTIFQRKNSQSLPGEKTTLQKRRVSLCKMNFAERKRSM